MRKVLFVFFAGVGCFLFAIVFILLRSRPDSSLSPTVSSHSAKALLPPVSGAENSPTTARAVSSFDSNDPEKSQRVGEAEMIFEKNGQFASMEKALTAARHTVEKIDPHAEHSGDDKYFTSNPGRQLRTSFSGHAVEWASGNQSSEGEAPWSKNPDFYHLI